MPRKRGNLHPPPLDLRLELAAEELVEPVFATAPEGDSRLFIVERNGRIRIVTNNALLAEPFLDIRSRVNFEGERGMHSMTFHPQYATNGRFFVYYVDLQATSRSSGLRRHREAMSLALGRG